MSWVHPASPLLSRCKEVCVWAHTDLPSLCIFCTVIHGRVLRPQAVYFQRQRVLGVVSGDGESALHRVCIVCAATTTTNNWDPVQPLPWSLLTQLMGYLLKVNPDTAQESLRDPPWLHQASPRLHQLHLTLDACKHRDILVRRLSHIHWFPHSPPLTSSVSLALHELPCKIATRTTQLSSNSMVSVLSWTPNWSTWESRARAPLPELQGQGWGCFISAEDGPYLHDLVVYKWLCHWMSSERAGSQSRCECLGFCGVDSIWEI